MIRTFTSPSCALHAAPPGFPERPERLAGLLARLESTAWPIERTETHPGSRPAVGGLHDPAYVERLQQAVASGATWLDSGDNPLSPGTWDAAWGSVDATLAAVDWALDGQQRVAFAAVRPPGHHAERGFAMGFCYFNNVAAAAEYARREYGLDKVAIVDFDVHHGNGTQHLFEERRDVLYASTHQWPFYPGTGASAETGIGDGDGATVNVPLPAGSGDETYRQALEHHLLPTVADFAPELLLVSAGFDAWQGDPLGGMRVSQNGFVEWGRLLGEMAAATCAGRVVAVLEGGYDLMAVPDLVVAHLEGVENGLDSR